MLALMAICCKAQIEDNTPTATPNAASLGTFGSIPVDLYTGTPSIAIPLYTYRSRDLSVPISLNYHSANIKPSSVPGWVGLGWSLQAGGVITRKQNDLPDELIDNFTNPATSRGFFYNYNNSTLNSSTWTAVNTMTTATAGYENQWNGPNLSLTHQRPDYAPDEFQFNFLGMSGSLIMGEDGQWHLKSKQGLNFTVTTEIGPYLVWEPNVNTQLGSHNFPSLIRNCLTRFILTATDGTKFFFGSDPAVTTHNLTPTYIYGYFATPDSAAVEFSRVGAGYSTSPDVTNRDGGTVATSWYLTKIQSVTGDSITFRYTRDGPQIIANTLAFGSFSECPNCYPNEAFTYGAGDYVTILDGCTLSSITGANGTIQFGKSVANVLDYTLLGNPETPLNLAWSSANNANGLYYAYANEVFQGYSSSSGPGVHSVFMELDNLKILDNFNNVIKSYAFSYSKSPATRLFLNSITETGADGTTLPPYSFSYNNTAGLNTVPYNTMQVDHWGYYNAHDPFAGLFTTTGVEPTTLNPLTSTGAAMYDTYSSSTLQYSNAFNSTFDAGYVANRTPVDGPLEYGILTQITYPTGGNSQFSWEPNYYSKYISSSLGPSNLNLSVVDLNANTIGPGVRIHQISSQANFNSPAVTKTYTYYRDYVNNNYTSSGVLNSAQPSYCDTYSSSAYLFRDWSSQNVVAAHFTESSPITYTNVQEQNSDGSYKTYTYTNQDNGYLDQPGNSYIGNQFTTNISPVLQTLNVNSLELERGLVLQESSYKTGSTLLYTKARQYNSDPNRFGSYIRHYGYDKKFSLNGVALSFDDGGFLTLSAGSTLYYGDITSALSIYYDYPYLQSETVTQYDQNGSNPTSIVTNYTYDGYRNKKTESYTSSQGESVAKSYNYAPDAISGLSSGAQQAQSDMRTAGMVGVQLERTETRGGNQTDHFRLDYQDYQSGNTLIVPANSWQSAYGAGLVSKTGYANFDNAGNVIQYTTRNGLSTCYDWGYNQAYPTVKITNASNTYHSWTTTYASSSSQTITWAPSVFTGQNVTFTVTTPGTIYLSGGFSEYPGSDNYTFNYQLTGPLVGQSSVIGSFCIAGPNGTCSGAPSSAQYAANPGTYTLFISPNSNYSIGSSFSYTWPVLAYSTANAGSKNYFYEGFEENSNISVISGTSHTGNFYWNGSTYTPGFTPPDNNAYTIEWWGLQGGNWTYHTQSYSSGMSLSGPVDDVRIFPAGSMMSTYTYQPLVGMTSEIDPRGYTTYFAYDAFGRLATESNKDRNIVKQLCYDYSGQSQTCPVFTPSPPQSVNSSNSTTEDCTMTFFNTVTNNSYTFTLPAGGQTSFKVPQGTYNVLMGPVTPVSTYSISWTYNGSNQNYYATVEFGGVTVNGPVTVTMTH